jgi:hypothetical protein
LHDLEIAIGQYELCRTLLVLTESDRQLFLAISDIVYDNLFTREAIEAVVQTVRMNLLVVSLDSEEIVRWIS